MYPGMFLIQWKVKCQIWLSVSLVDVNLLKREIVGTDEKAQLVCVEVLRNHYSLLSGIVWLSQSQASTIRVYAR